MNTKARIIKVNIPIPESIMDCIHLKINIKIVERFLLLI